MRPIPSSEHDEQDQKIIELLKDLGSVKSMYPPELLAARRAAFLARADELSPFGAEEDLSPEDQEFVSLLTDLRTVQVEYPEDLQSATRSALLQQIEAFEKISVWDRFRISIGRIVHYKTTFPTVRRLSLLIASFVAVLLIGSLLFPRAEPSFQPSSSETAAMHTYTPRTGTGEVAITICSPGDETPACLSGDFTAGQDLANTENGVARPAISNDARAVQGRVHAAAHVNDGRSGASWVSNSMDSWIKIDLGEVRTIDTVSLLKGSPGSAGDHDPGQFVIAVALSDVYVDGDSSDDSVEYVQVFHSDQTGFSGAVSQAETVRTRFPAVKARYVKIMFEKAGAAIEEVGVFLVKPPVLAEQSTNTPQDNPAGTTSSPMATGTSVAMNTATLALTGTQLPTDTPAVILTNTLLPANTATPLPTNTLLPPAGFTPVPTEPLPSDTPLPPPTIILPTAVPPTIQQPPVNTDPIVVTGNEQNQTFTCNGNAAEIRGHNNIVTLFGSCSSITVTGNGNRVFWESGSPVITIKGKDNIVQQL